MDPNQVAQRNADVFCDSASPQLHSSDLHCSYLKSSFMSFWISTPSTVRMVILCLGYTVLKKKRLNHLMNW